MVVSLHFHVCIALSQCHPFNQIVPVASVTKYFLQSRIICFCWFYTVSRRYNSNIWFMSWTTENAGHVCRHGREWDILFCFNHTKSQLMTLGGTTPYDCHVFLDNKPLLWGTSVK